MLDVRIREKKYGNGAGHPAGHLALRDVGFTVQRNEFVCIVGPSGCGKTTCLRLILGLDTRFDGQISLGDTENTGVVFQEPRLLPWRTVLQNIVLAQREEDPALVEDLLAELGLSEHKDFFPGQLSLGLARRVALARAFAVKPALLVLDEPFVSLDEETANRLRQLLLKVWSSRPTTVLMVTHNIQEAMQLADRILVFSGRPGTVRGDFSIDCAREARTTSQVGRLIEDFQQTFQNAEGAAEKPASGSTDVDRTAAVATDLRAVLDYNISRDPWIA